MAAIKRLWSTKRRFRLLAIIFGVGLIYLLPFLAMPGLAAIYLKIDGIEGEVVTKGYEKSIRVDSATWNTKREISSVYGGTREGSAPVVSDLTISKQMDKSSVLLFKEAVAGAQGRTATLYFTRNLSTGAEATYYQMTLTDMLVSGFAQSAGDTVPVESISLNFGKVRLDYTPYVGDKPGTAVTAEYDLSSGKIQ